MEFASQEKIRYLTIVDSLKKILLDKDHTGIQFLKYSMCGGVAFLTDFFLFYLFALTLFPALTPDDVAVRLMGVDVEPITEALRLRNFWICKAVGFAAANMVAYILNVLFVFKAGKHRKHYEITLFYAVSLVAFLLGTWSGDALIRFFSIQTTVSYLTAIIFATLVNYAGRKYFIFHG